MDVITVRRARSQTAGAPVNTLPFITSDPTDAQDFRRLFRGEDGSGGTAERKLAYAVFDSGIASYLSTALSWRADDERDEAELWLEADRPEVTHSFAWLCALFGFDAQAVRVALRARRQELWSRLFGGTLPRSPRPWSPEALPYRCSRVLTFLAANPGPKRATAIGIGIQVGPHGADWAIRKLLERGYLKHLDAGYVAVPRLELVKAG